MVLDIVVLLAVVAAIFLRLRSVLGTRPGPEPEIDAREAGKVFDALVGGNGNGEKKIIDAQAVVVDEPSDEISRTLARIPGFDKDKFLNSAKKAFEMIVAAFAGGDCETLEPLLAPALMKKFHKVIETRKAEGMTAETDFIAFKSVEIADAGITPSGVAKIVVDFRSEQINLLKNAAGEVVEGDENYIQTISDRWTFERPVDAATPSWLLVSTKK